MLSLKRNQQWLAFKAGCAYASFFYSILWATIPKKQLNLIFSCMPSSFLTFFFRRRAINKQRSTVFGPAVSNRSTSSETIQQR